MFSIAQSDFSHPSVGSQGIARSFLLGKAPRSPRSVDTSDEALIGAVAGGDRPALEVLYARHNVRVYRFVLRIVGNDALAEDIVSDVFLEVWRHAERFSARSQVSTWLLAIARNKALSALRRRSCDHLDEQAAAAIEDPADGPDVAVQAKDRSVALRTCLSQLSATQREVIDLAYYHEKSIEEVAQIVGVPENTVKTRMYYARRRMAELLKADGFDEL